MSIINDIEVEECKYYREKDKNCDVWGIPCNMKEHCYFKQLKRLEKENEIITMENQEAREIVAELEYENKELKKELQKYRDMAAKGLEEFKDVGGCWGCGIQLSADEYVASSKKYEQALEEIREIAKREYHKPLKDKDCIECDSDFWLIIDTINKVLESEEK